MQTKLAIADAIKACPCSCLQLANKGTISPGDVALYGPPRETSPQNLSASGISLYQEQGPRQKALSWPARNECAAGRLL
jgi:hypothetical protein